MIFGLMCISELSMYRSSFKTVVFLLTVQYLTHGVNGIESSSNEILSKETSKPSPTSKASRLLSSVLSLFQKRDLYGSTLRNMDALKNLLATWRYPWIQKEVAYVESNNHQSPKPSYRIFLRTVVVENSTNEILYTSADGNGDDNCTHPTEPQPRYNSSCEFVHAECADKAELVDYLAFICCDLAVLQVSTS